MRTSLAVPLVTNVGGTSAQNLETQARAVRNSARELLDALNHAAPKECDYQSDAQAAEWERAVKEHTERCRWVNKLRNDFDAILAQLQDQAQNRAQSSKSSQVQGYGRRI